MRAYPDDPPNRPIISRPAFWWLVIAVLLFVAMFASCYSPPAWYRQVEQTRLNPQERRFAMVLRSSFLMQPQGLATFPDGGIPITFHEEADVWLCDPVQQFARRIATIQRPSWVAGESFYVWMIDWQSNAGRSSLFLRVSGKSGAAPRNINRQYVRVDFDQSSATAANVVWLDSPQIDTQPSPDMVNTPSEYGLMNIRNSGDTLLVWADRAPDWRARFLVDKKRGIQVLQRVPRRQNARVEVAHPEWRCPDSIQGVIAPGGSRISTGGEPPIVTAVITEVDVTCSEGRHPIVGSEEDGEIEFTVNVRVDISFEVKDEVAYRKTKTHLGGTILLEAMSDSSVVLGSAGVPFEPYPLGVRGVSTGTSIEGLTWDEIPHVTRVVARWSH